MLADELQPEHAVSLYLLDRNVGVRCNAPSPFSFGIPFLNMLVEPTTTRMARGDKAFGILGLLRAVARGRAAPELG